MDRFELESRIMDCWSVVEDVQTVYKMSDLRQLSQDELANVLLGIQTLYQMKFERLWQTFEEYIRNEADRDHHKDDRLLSELCCSK